jgi:serine protease Do
MNRCVILPLAVLGLSLAAGAQVPATTNSAKASAADAASSSPSDVLRQWDEALDALALHAMPAIVQIEISGFGPREKSNGDQDVDVIQRQRAIGSGVIVDPNGYIMTNAHVVSGAQRIRVVLTQTVSEFVTYKSSLAARQRVYEGQLIGVNRLVDLALIKIEEKDLPYLPLKDEYRVHLGQTVLAVGSPEGLEHTITRGIVSAVGRQINPDRPMVYIQTDAPINPGNSGGALIDRDGNLIGINTFIFSSGGGSEGLGFAIPEPTVRFAFHEFKEHGRIRRTVIGANAQTITPDLAAALKLPREWGVIISDVLPEGPGAKAGLKSKDIVLTLDNHPIDSLPKFSAWLYLHKHDEVLQMEVLRDGQTVKLLIPAIEAPKGIERLADLIDPQKSLINSLGVFLLDLNSTITESLPDLRSTSGVLVIARVEYMPRFDADLRVGDVVRSINGIPLSSTDDLRSQLSKLKARDAVALEVERQGQFQFVTFEVE